MKRSARIAMFVILMVTVLEATAFGGTYYFYTRHYVSTNNAVVDGDKIDINAPTTGTLAGWSVDEGSEVRTNQVLGRIRILGSGAQPERTIKSPGNGTVVLSDAVDGQFISAGTELATAYDFSKIYVTARVDESDIADVAVGQIADIAVDAYPDAKITGIVEEIQNSAASEFAIYPGPSTDPTNPQKVTQYVPVKIGLLATDGRSLVPGMSVTVHIHKN
jgi:multidrug resistance efflux pump